LPDYRSYGCSRREAGVNEEIAGGRWLQQQRDFVTPGFSLLFSDATGACRA